MTNNPGASPAVRLSQMLAYNLTQMIYVAVKLGIPDLLVDGPKSVDELGAKSGAHPPSLYRLLRALASLDIFSEDTSGRFRLTPLSELLRSENPGSLRPFALAYGEPWWWSAWGNLLHSVQTGETAFVHVFQKSLFQFLSGDADAARIFNANMTAMTSEEAQAVVTAYDFSGTSFLVDVGAGQGSLAAAILRAHPQTRAIVFDSPSVIAGARTQLRAAEVGERCQMVGGSFFEWVPKGGDVYVLKDILHDWDDQNAIHILQNCRIAMRDSARLLVIERIITPGNEGAVGKLIDISMLVFTGGRERTEAEYRALLAPAGFQIKKVIPAGETNILEAVPAIKLG